MDTFQFTISGDWAHFKKPETNNNPLTYDFIPKTALIGLIGAVLGIEREDMLQQFPLLSDDLVYGVQLLSPVIKTSWGFTSRTAINPVAEGTPKYFEFLRDPAYLITIGLQNERSADIYHRFKKSVKEELAVYTPILGWHNLPANLEWKSEGESELHEGDFITKGFIPLNEFAGNSLTPGTRIRFENIPTKQNDDFMNLPDKYKEVAYPDFPDSIVAKGKHYAYICNEQTENWCLI